MLAARVQNDISAISVSEVLHSQSYVKRAYQLALLLLVLQIADACLTWIGVTRFGIASEGNPLLQILMVHIGELPTLALVKITAIIAGFTLASYTHRVRWVPKALGGVCCFYFFFAVLPWAYLLITDLS